MTRKFLFVLVVLALLGATGAVQATAAKPTKHTTTYTTKQRFRTHDGKTVTGIRTNTGQVFQGFDRVVETVDPTPTLMAPDAASALAWQKVAYIQDEATWTGSGDGYYYILAVAADIGWQAQANGQYLNSGPYQYRQQPACFRYVPPNGQEIGTPCNFAWYVSALKAKHCAASEACAVAAPWGTRDFYQGNVLAVLFAGTWHDAFAAGYGFPDTGALMTHTADATARFLTPNHLSRIYCTGSFWWTITYHQIASDTCTGLVAI